MIRWLKRLWAGWQRRQRILDRLEAIRRFYRLPQSKWPRHIQEEYRELVDKL